MNDTIGRGIIFATVLMLLVSVASVGMGAAAPAPNDEQNWDSDSAVNPYIYEDYVVVNEHNRSAMSSPLEYYDDSGSVVMLDAEQNDSIDNPVKYQANKVDSSVLYEFPRKDAEVGDNVASAIDSTEWAKDAGSSAGTGTISSTDVSGVDAVQFSTSSQTSGDVMTFTYDNFTVDSDAEKRVPLLVGSVDSLDTGATVTVNFTESDGDVKSVTIDSAANADDAGVAANSTAAGMVWQQKLSDVATEGSGDGTFSSIDSITVEVDDANAQLTFTGIDSERKDKIALGQHDEDTDGDDELETVTTYENADGGVIELSSMATLPTQFADAQIMDLEVYGLSYSAEYLDSEDVYVNWSDATAYPNFEKKQDASYRLSVPAAIDLEHNGLELRTDQAVVSDRYLDFRYAEGTGDTEPGDIDSWTDASGDLTGVGDTLTLDSTIQAGQNVMFDSLTKYTAGEYDELTAAGGSGDGPVESTGLLDGFLGWLAAIGAGILGFIGLRSSGE